MGKEKTELDLLKEINHKIEMLICGMSIQNRPPEEKVRILSRAGRSNKEIAMITCVSVIDVQNIKARKIKKNKQVKG